MRSFRAHRRAKDEQGKTHVLALILIVVMLLAVFGPMVFVGIFILAILRALGEAD